MTPIWALGLMSGTSMDGVDAALVRTDGADVFGFGPSHFRPYTDEERAILSAAQGMWPGRSNALVAASEVIHHAHLEAIRALPPAEVIGFHGQTLAHDPERARTHQLGDGARLAAAAGVPVVWDFRSADMRAGGQGAPLAPFYHFALARAVGLTAPVVFLNIGGVANVTWVNPRCAAPEAPGALLAFDTGPGNALMDDFVMARRGVRFDDKGALARGGRVQDVSAIGQGFLQRTPPKSLDRHDFHAALEMVAPLSDADGMATLLDLTVDTIAKAQLHFPSAPVRWLVCGGGRKNATLMDALSARLSQPVDPVEAVGLDGDMLEAQAFGHLAVRVLTDQPTSAPGTTGCAAPVCGGQISRI
ncbi:anhydro-N-acetylmuramic acid kinase [Rubricella aquisinus]|uniref:Anhydro-N-acetylmuramic acid kinase n=1 Tax=Rubricella aquisinus TaxID=2028108 RepID=A0A840X2C8_9RHOB|nr:anhydro-N-acetylmuramic acid kinase [Rubricella aquisinus]MBB5514827.1 anhydro-N-acetylmuramic acid kinase [Rubricella aquisinus]